MPLYVTPAEIDAPSDREPDWALEIPDDYASHAEEQRRHAVIAHDMCGPDEAIL